MTEFVLRECKIDEDAAALAPSAADERLRGRPAEIRRWMKYNMDRGPSFTALYEGRIMAAWGVRWVRQGVGTAWAVFSTDMPYGQSVPTAEAIEYLQEAVWTAEHALAIVVSEFRFKRIRAHSRKGFAASQRLLRHLGFEQLKRETKTHIIFKRKWE